MKNINLLDLEEDILNIIGDFVKQDNKYRIKKENDFKKTDEILEYLKKKKMFIAEEIGEAIYSQLFKNCYSQEDIEEYEVTRKLKNLLKT